jgi:hypothetical protein
MIFSVTYSVTHKNPARLSMRGDVIKNNGLSLYVSIDWAALRIRSDTS